MRYFRSILAVVLAFSLLFWGTPPAPAAHSAIGILTLATHAHLNEAMAFPGLSVFEGERLSTDGEGRLGVRAGHSILTLGPKTEVELVSINGGLHVDMSFGALHFSGAENEIVEVHAEDAILGPASTRPTQGTVIIVSSKVLQITTERGSLNFSCHGEFRNLPEGQTYQIYLDAPGESQEATSAGMEKAGVATKVTYFIVSAGVAGTIAWGVHNALKSENLPISPAKP